MANQKLLFGVLILVFVVTVLMVGETSAVCCQSQGGTYSPKTCRDGTGPTPCCGRGKCNIFCCNCDGGCRERSRIIDLISRPSP